MRRVDKFVLRHNPYAVDLSSMVVVDHHVTLRAVWFRRKNGVTTAAIGELRDYAQTPPTTAEEFLTGYTNSRLGGDCMGRWNGTGYWGAQDLKVQAKHLEILRPMLENYPNVPPGFDGWWQFS